MKLFATRLTPGTDLKPAIASFAKAHSITAGVIISGVGSLESVNVRLAGAQPGHQPNLQQKGEYEIVSLHGTVGMGDMHVHMAVSDKTGAVLGGHLRSGCIIKTTVELVILADAGQRFARTPDLFTGFDELEVRDV